MMSRSGETKRQICLHEISCKCIRIIIGSHATCKVFTACCCCLLFNTYNQNYLGKDTGVYAYKKSRPILILLNGFVLCRPESGGRDQFLSC